MATRELEQFSAIGVIVWHATIFYVIALPSLQKDLIIVLAAVSSFAVPHSYLYRESFFITTTLAVLTSPHFIKKDLTKFYPRT